jgi:hypothetical protein
MGTASPTGWSDGIVVLRANLIDGSREVSTEGERGRSGMRAMVASSAQPAISCDLR